MDSNSVPRDAGDIPQPISWAQHTAGAQQRDLGVVKDNGRAVDTAAHSLKHLP
jgi:hypothetical protein